MTTECPRNADVWLMSAYVACGGAILAEAEVALTEMKTMLTKSPFQFALIAI